jgi:hypothetical protein
MVCAVAVTAAAGISGCERTPTDTDDPVGRPLFAWTPGGADEEGELLGKVWDDSGGTKGIYYVVLEPLQSLGSYPLVQPWSGTMWADTGAHYHGWMYEWSDPLAGGKCGDLTDYLAGDTVRHHETHWSGPNSTPDTTGPEVHCVMPGRYQFTLRMSNPEGDVVKQFPIEYLAWLGTGLTKVDNATLDLDEALEDLYGERDDTSWQDLTIQVDLSGNAGNSDTPVLHIQNARATWDSLRFQDEASPSGNEDDHFRFSGAGSSITWNRSAFEGKALSRLYFDLGPYPATDLNSTGYYDARSDTQAYGIRIHQFAEHVTASRTVRVGLELMRPDEDPGDTVNAAKRTIQITRETPVACIRPVYDSTWAMSDQYVSAGCSSLGSSIRYRWGDGSVWTDWMPDTLYDFPGHSQSGSRQLRLTVKNLSTGRTRDAVVPIGVSSDEDVLTGDLFVTDKQVHVYRQVDSLPGYWWERWNPEYEWTRATAPCGGCAIDSLPRIWPAGDYTVEVRHEIDDVPILKRGRLHVTRCHFDLGPCQQQMQAPIALAPPQKGMVAPVSEIFGGGPWVSWGSVDAPGAIRFYDLLGAHDAPATFGTTAWLSQDVGAAADAGATGPITWRRLDIEAPGTYAVIFTAAARATKASYRFAFAVDPDLGAEPADDRSGYDGARGMVYVFDRDRAIGFLLRNAAGDAMEAAQEYGVGRWAPTSPVAAWEAQRAGGVHLIGKPRDVQLLLSAGDATDTTSWIVLVVGGETVTELQNRADAALAALAAQE